MKFRCKDIEIHFVFLTSLALRFISWYSARVLAHVMDGETLWMKDSPLIGIWMWHRCYEQCSFLDDDIIELGLVLRDCARSSRFSLSLPTMMAHLINEAYELWSQLRVVYSSV